jgi:NTE family protein
VTNALVLAGGGVAGIAWELGVLRGIADEDPDLAARLIAADIIVGTSAGSSVAAQITSGTPLAELYDAQLRAETAEIEVDVDLEDMLRRYAEAMRNPDDADEEPDPIEQRRRMGALALAAPTVAEPVRLAAIAARLPHPGWPGRTLLIPAVDAVTGETVVFTRESGVDLVDAVAASCAVPGVWPPVTIGARRFVDGGIRSGTNADLADGADRILVVEPALEDAPQSLGNLDEEIATLRPGETYVIWADQASVAAFGTNPLSPATRGPGARAGRAVGRAQAKAVAEFWR